MWSLWGEKLYLKGKEHQEQKNCQLECIAWSPNQAINSG
jgi:hypothetical protein